MTAADPNQERPIPYMMPGETLEQALERIGPLEGMQECECGRGVYGCEKCRGEFR